MSKEPFSSQQELRDRADRWFKEGADDARAGLSPRHAAMCACYPWYIDGYNSAKNPGPAGQAPAEKRMKSKALKPGDLFKVDKPDPEGPVRVCLSNDAGGIRWGFPHKKSYWCFMGGEVEVELVGRP